MDDITYSVYKSLQLMDVSYTKRYIEFFLDNHTDTHSMLCLSDLFDSYNVENTAGEFDSKVELIKYPGVHISNLMDKDISYFVVVVSVTEDTVTFYNKGKKITESTEEYFKKWKGFVLFFTKKPDSIEPNYTENKKKERIEKFKISLHVLSISILFIAIVYACLPILIPFTFISLLSIKLSGIGVSILLLSYTYNSENSLLKGICNVGKKTNCSSILNSKAAKVFSFLSWSEVGLFYFTSTFITLLITGVQQQTQGYYLLVGLNVLALPYTLYSVYYQKKVAKSWCVMCLSIQALLVLEFATGLSLWSSFSIQNIVTSSITMLTSGLFVITAWYSIKPLLQANTDLKIARKDLKKFKQSLPLFNYALSNQPNLSYPKQAEVLHFGSLYPKVHFTIFTSPVCPHCSKAHITFNKLLNTYPNDIAYTEIFAVSNDERDERVQIAAHMLQLYKINKKEYASQAINDWHADEEKRMEEWISKYPVVGDALNENKDIIGFHSAIANNLGIHQTPTIVMNGKLLPDLYRVEDLEKIIPTFLASSEHNN